MIAVEIFHIRDLDSSMLRSERERVLRLVREMIPFASVMEVGSTAIEGLVGKQDLDFVARVPLQCFTKARSILDEHFQRNDRQLSNAEYQAYFVPSPLDVAIQLIISGGKHDNFEKFLDLLSTDHDLRRAYNDLKAAWNGRSMDGYRLAKQAFIDAALSNNKRQVLNDRNSNREDVHHD